MVEHYEKQHPEAPDLRKRYRCGEQTCSYANTRAVRVKEHCQHDHGKVWTKPGEEPPTRRPSSGPEETIEHLLVCPALVSKRLEHSIAVDYDERGNVRLSTIPIHNLVSFVRGVVEVWYPP